METLWVVSSGCPVRKEGLRPNIGEDGKDQNVIENVPVEVPNNQYYRTLVREGDLVKVED